MAIDTAARRLSIMDMEASTMPGIPMADGDFDAADRAHLLWLYSGLDAGGGPGPGGFDSWLIMQRRRQRR